MTAFDRYFERDFISGEEFVQMYGAGCSEVFTIAGFGMRDSFDTNERKTVPKPVVYLAELPGGKPVFLNRGSHEALIERFGHGYSENPKVIGQLVTITSEQKRTSRDGVTPVEYMCIVWFTPTEHPDMHAPIGEKIAAKWLDRLKEFGGNATAFLAWLRPQNQDLWQLLSTCSKPSEYPRGAMARMGAYVEHSLKTKAAAAAKPALAPAKPPASAGQERAVPAPQRVEQPDEITEDDIPF